MCMKAKSQRLKGNICILFITVLSKSRHFGTRHFFAQLTFWEKTFWHNRHFRNRHFGSRRFGSKHFSTTSSKDLMIHPIRPASPIPKVGRNDSGRTTYGRSDQDSTIFHVNRSSTLLSLCPVTIWDSPLRKIKCHAIFGGICFVLLLSLKLCHRACRS